MVGGKKRVKKKYSRKREYFFFNTRFLARPPTMKKILPEKTAEIFFKLKMPKKLRKPPHHFSARGPFSKWTPAPKPTFPPQSGTPQRAIQPLAMWSPSRGPAPPPSRSQGPRKPHSAARATPAPNVVPEPANPGTRGPVVQGPPSRPCVIQPTPPPKQPAPFSAAPLPPCPSGPSCPLHPQPLRPPIRQPHQPRRPT